MQSPSKSQQNFFTDHERTIIKFIWQNKKPRTAKTILYKKVLPEALPSLTSNYYRDTVMKTAWYWDKNRDIDQWN